MEIFNPVAYSIEENQFLIKHLGEAPEVVEMDYPSGQLPVGVNSSAVMPALEKVFRLMQQEEHRGLTWQGVEAVREACKTYVTQYARWQAERARGGPKLPSRYVWDERGRSTKGAVGADGAIVSTYFDETGDRKKFALDLLRGDEATYRPDWIRPADKKFIPKLLEDAEKGTIECPVCHWVQNYDVETPSTLNTARGRMAKHLLSSRKNPDMHREVYTQEFQRGEVNA